MSLSKIASVTLGKTWTSKHGDEMHNHDYVMEDGTKLQAAHKEKNKFSVGDEVEYEITKKDEQYGDKGKVKKPDTGFKGGGYKPRLQTWEESMEITRDSCFGAACEFYARYGVDSLETITTLADRFIKFVIHGTEQVDFEMWGDIHKKIIHRSSVIKSVAKVGKSEDGCLKLAMEAIKYVNNK